MENRENDKSHLIGNSEYSNKGEGASLPAVRITKDKIKSLHGYISRLIDQIWHLYLGAKGSTP